MTDDPLRKLGRELRDAIFDPGPQPRIHDRERNHLMHNWPRLWRIINEIIQEAIKEPPRSQVDPRCLERSPDLILGEGPAVQYVCQRPAGHSGAHAEGQTNWFTTPRCDSVYGPSYAHIQCDLPMPHQSLHSAEDPAQPGRRLQWRDKRDRAIFVQAPPAYTPLERESSRLLEQIHVDPSSSRAMMLKQGFRMGVLYLAEEISVRYRRMSGDDVTEVYDIAEELGIPHDVLYSRVVPSSQCGSWGPSSYRHRCSRPVSHPGQHGYAGVFWE